jgi:two-component system response regulator
LQDLYLLSTCPLGQLVWLPLSRPERVVRSIGERFFPKAAPPPADCLHRTVRKSDAFPDLGRMCVLLASSRVGFSMNSCVNTRRADILFAISGAGAELCMEALHREGLGGKVVLAHDGEQALDFLFSRGKHVGRSCEDPLRLLLLDSGLTKVSGIEVLRQAKSDARTRTIPAVLLTPPDDADFTSQAYQLGANSCLRRSPDPEKFSQTIRAAGMYWISVNRPACGDLQLRGAAQE